MLQAVSQMDEKLKAFITENQATPEESETNGVICFVHKQILHLAQDVLDKSQDNMLSSLYFHELSENLGILSTEVSSPPHRKLCHD